MAYAPATLANRPGQSKEINGYFKEVEFSHPYEYQVRPEEAPWAEFPVRVWVGYGQSRWARLLKTVAYVVTDEAADGSPVVEKWAIKDHRVYN